VSTAELDALAAERILTARSGLEHSHSAVDGDQLTGDEPGALAREEDQHGRQVSVGVAIAPPSGTRLRMRSAMISAPSGPRWVRNRWAFVVSTQGATAFTVMRRSAQARAAERVQAWDRGLGRRVVDRDGCARDALHRPDVDDRATVFFMRAKAAWFVNTVVIRFTDHISVNSGLANVLRCGRGPPARDVQQDIDSHPSAPR